MAARRYDSPLRYMVDSHSRDGVEHLVEIDMYGGNGCCACEHFHYRLEPIMQNSGVKPSNATRCIHIMEARDQFIDDVIALIQQRQKDTGVSKKMSYHK
jgi:hypothetical protein